MRDPFEKVTKRASEYCGISIEEAHTAKRGDWHEGTRYCDGGFDFTQVFENPETRERFTVEYSHVSDKAF